MTCSRGIRSLGFVLCLVPGVLHAQTVVGEVVERGTGRAVYTAFVRLIDAAGAARVATLTDTAGRFVLRTPAPGRYALRVERIGHETVTTPAFDIAAGATVRRRIEVDMSVIALDAIRVERSARNCVLAPRAGLRTQRLWEEARKALNLAAWSESQGYRFYTVLYRRTLDLDGRRVLREDADSVPGLGQEPFYTLPVRELERGGYIQPAEDGAYDFYAPNADALLSDAFLASHCVRAVVGEGEEAGWVGLAFEPASQRDMADIAGVLWLDARSAELRRLDFRYTRLPWGAPVGDFGGTLEFRRLPAGIWVIQRWSIRIPRMVRRFGGPIITGDPAKLEGVDESAGEVLALVTPAGESLPVVGRASLVGLVFDSTTMRPLADARIVLEGTSHAARTDGAGRFRLDGLPAGTYGLAFTHPHLESLGYAPEPREVELERGEITSVALHVPSLAAILGAGCAADAREDDRGVLVGLVRDSVTGAPLAGARVILTWTAERAAAGRLETRTDARGRYRFCDAPAGIGATAAADFLGEAEARTRVRLAEAGPVLHNFRLAVNRPGGVRGRILDAGDGAPIAGAVVALGGTERRQLTDSAGRFAFRQVPPGGYALEVEHIAYGRRAHPVTVRSGLVEEVEMRLGREAIGLDPIQVTVRSRPLIDAMMFTDLERRMRRSRDLGLGYILGPEEVAVRPHGSLTELLRGVPGIRVVTHPDLPGRYTVRMTGQRGNACGVQLYVDGVRYRLAVGRGAPETLDDAVPGGMIYAVEVYRSPSEMPAAFIGQDSRCGVIAVWTKRGTRR